MPGALRGPVTLLIAMMTAACAAEPRTPDAVYRAALEEALREKQCAGPAIDAVWSAYDVWYAVASSIPHYYRGSEASALLLQAEAFRALGCEAVARASYEELLRRFPDETFAIQRLQALRGLATMAPPYPLVGPATRGAARPDQRPPNTAPAARLVNDRSLS